MRNQSRVVAGIVCSILLFSVAGGVARAQDPENCLSCHRFRGLTRLDTDTNEIRLFFADAAYYAHRQGAHSRLRCTDCHEREEVRQVPHSVRTKVDCTRTCHISPAAPGLALEFSHRGVADSIEQSVHSSENLDELVFDPPPLREGQSNCLYCHDEPTFGFRRGVPEGFRDHSGGTRCDTCHRETLPLEITYFANHVAARMRPAQSVRRLAQTCGTCHSDPAINEQIRRHDAVGSYLHSFHGKASLLGSTETATCMDCHSSPGSNQHLILSPQDEFSPVNAEMLPNTCRTTACHPGYPPGMSTAAVHLDLDSTEFPAEFLVAAAFVLLTAITMIVFFALVVLELINAVVRRSDPEDERFIRLVRAVRAHPEGRRLLQRMTVHERVQHWALVIGFALLVFTGMPIKFASESWALSTIRFLGELSFARLIHRGAGVFLITVFLYHIGYLCVLGVKKWRAQRRAGRKLSFVGLLTSHPMMLWPEDLVHFGHLVAYLLGLRRERPAFGRYGFHEKFEYWAVFWGMPVMGLSGMALWGMPWISENISGRVINFAFIIHSDESYLAFIYIAAIHLFSVVFSPAVFPLSRGTLTGQAPSADLVERHRGFIEELADRLEIPHPPEDPAHKRKRQRRSLLLASVARRVYAAGATVLCCVVAYMSLRFLLVLLFSHEAAPVDIVGIPTRLDADQFFTTASDVPARNGRDDEQMRGPLAHYHQIPQWFQPDPGSTCATAGCHSPLPHTKRIEVRAFLNMHTTFVDCLICHAERSNETARVGWYSLADQAAVDSPAMLNLVGYVEGLGAIAPDDAPNVSLKLQELIRAALPFSGENPQLSDWLLRLETTHPRSKIWNDIVDEIHAEIQLHMHGEYGAKLGWFVDNQLVRNGTTDQQAATREFLRRAAERGAVDDAGNEALLDRVHANVAPKGAMCTPCHSQDPTLANVAELGYSPARVRSLQESLIMRSVLRIEAGEPFFLPLGDESGRP